MIFWGLRVKYEYLRVVFIKMVTLDPELAEESTLSIAPCTIPPGARWCPSPGQVLMLLNASGGSISTGLFLAHVNFCSILVLLLLTLRKQQQRRAWCLEPTQVLCASLRVYLLTEGLTWFHIWPNWSMSFDSRQWQKKISWEKLHLFTLTVPLSHHPY